MSVRAMGEKFLFFFSHLGGGIGRWKGKYERPFPSFFPPFWGGASRGPSFFFFFAGFQTLGLADTSPPPLCWSRPSVYSGAAHPFLFAGITFFSYQRLGQASAFFPFLFPPFFFFFSWPAKIFRGLDGLSPLFFLVRWVQ